MRHVKLAIETLKALELFSPCSIRHRIFADPSPVSAVSTFPILAELRWTQAGSLSPATTNVLLIFHWRHDKSLVL